MNLIGRTGTADYLVTGSWSAKAAKEAAKYGKVNMVVPKKDKYTGIPAETEWNLDPSASYFYYCDNETVLGIEFGSVPDVKVPIVCDISSNALSRAIDVKKVSRIYGLCAFFEFLENMFIPLDLISHFTKTSLIFLKMVLSSET